MDSAVIGGIARTLITSAGAGLVAKGVLEAEQLNQIAGGIVVALTLAWSIYQKYATKKQITIAAQTGVDPNAKK